MISKWKPVALPAPIEDEDEAEFYDEAGIPRDYKFDPNQPRDTEGKWTRIPGSLRIAPFQAVKMAKSETPEDEVTFDALTESEREKVIAVWEKKTGVTADEAKANLGAVLRAAGPDSVEGGKAWYREAHEWAVEHAKLHDLKPEQVAGVLSALSPMTEWGWNREHASLLLQHYSADPEKFKAQDPQQAYRGARDAADARGIKWPLPSGYEPGERAAMILQGTPVEKVLLAPKTRSFYNSIAEPNNPYDVVVDTHMINAAYGGLTPGTKGLLIEVAKPPAAKAWGPVVTPEDAPFVARKPFSWFSNPSARGRKMGVAPFIADAIREAAADWNVDHPDDKLTPMQAQAIIWVEWLKRHPYMEKNQAVKASQRATEAAALALA